MPNIEFGEWITVDTTPKPRRKRTIKSVEIIETRPIIKMSNACMLEKHTLCTGVMYSGNHKGYVKCECECGICEKSAGDMAILEIVACNDAWLKFKDEHDDADMDSFQKGWLAAKEYFNAN